MPPRTTRKRAEKSTKQELLETLEPVAQELLEHSEATLNPERRVEQRRSEEAVRIASAIATDEIDRGIGELKASIGKALGEVADRIAAESAKFRNLQVAIAAKEKEVQELYGIEKSAASLAALIEAQNLRRQQFEDEMSQARAELESEMEGTRSEWEREGKKHEAETRERDLAEKKVRDREKEEFQYNFKREQQSMRDQLADEKKKLELELQSIRESALKDLVEREKVLAVKESAVASLESKVEAFPGELESTVAKAVQDISSRLQLEAKNREELLTKDFAGQKGVLATRIELLEKAGKEQTEQIVSLSRQLETAYQKVQEIAEKAIEGSSQSKALGDLQRLLGDQVRKASSEKM